METKEDEQMKNAVELIQNPIIKHRIIEIGASVRTRIASLNISNLIVNEDSIQAIKKLRANLNKELKEFEDQFKLVETPYLAPLKEVKELKTKEINSEYSNADNILKDAIGLFENTIKQEKKKSVEIYFNELCVSEKIDFIKLEQVIAEVNLSTSEKKYKDICNDFITKVIDDINFIKTSEYEAEIMSEYKVSLNASKATTTVKERKEIERAEAARIKAIETIRRQHVCKALGMTFVDITNSYAYSCDIYITRKQIEELSKDEFQSKVAECEAKIADVKAKELEAKKAAESTKQETVQAQIVAPTPTIVAPTPAAPIQAPIVETMTEVEEICEASFSVKGTMNQLRALGAFMKANSIEYVNI